VHAASYIPVRVAHTVLGGAVSVAWLVLPVMTINTRDPVPAMRAGPVAEAAVPGRRGTSLADLVPPLVAAGTAGALAGYAYVRRTRRARTRTTPGGSASAGPPAPTSEEYDRQSRTALVAVDDAVRTSREELACAEARFGAAAVEPFARALRAAETELSAAFAIRRRYDEGLPKGTIARRQALVGVVGRCAEAGRRLDAEAAGFDRLRALELDVDGAVGIAEGRLRELAGRAADADVVSAGLAECFGPSAAEPVRSHAELARERLVFASAQLDSVRPAAGSGEAGRAVRRLRAAEGALAQADILVTGVERLARELGEAAALVPSALTGAEATLTRARTGSDTARPEHSESPESPDRPEHPTERSEHSRSESLRAWLVHADTVLAAVRRELTGGQYDPLDALRRIARAVEPFAVEPVADEPGGAGQRGVVGFAAFLAARSATAATEDFVATHRAAVGAEARTLLAAAVRLLARGDTGPADELARAARESAERDVRTYGNPYVDVRPTGEAGYAGGPAGAVGVGGAVLGGVLLGEEPDGGPPASYGGPRTRGRRRLPGQ
jgi:hypothetical protein